VALLLSRHALMMVLLRGLLLPSPLMARWLRA
jgi:hypothetical protein